MSTAAANYFQRFFDEKNVGYSNWTIRDSAGTPHVLDSEFVIALIKQSTGVEAAKLVTILTKLDFDNAPILPFLKHLAIGFVANSAAPSSFTAVEGTQS